MALLSFVYRGLSGIHSPEYVLVSIFKNCEAIKSIFWMTISAIKDDKGIFLQPRPSCSAIVYDFMMQLTVT